MHRGTDFAGQRGDPILAAGNGKVIFRGRQGDYGRLIGIDHGGGIETWYAHLSRFRTREGRRVRQGQRIGKMGKSGNATGVHLHFEVRENGTKVDPLLYLDTRPR